MSTSNSDDPSLPWNEKIPDESDAPSIIGRIAPKVIGIALAIPFAWGLISWDIKNGNREEAQIANVMAIAKKAAEETTLHPGQIISDPKCAGNYCQVGTILSVPNSQQCGVIFLGVPGQAPTGVSVVTTYSGRMPMRRDVPNPNMRALCLDSKL